MGFSSEYTTILIIGLILSTLGGISAVTILSIERGKVWYQWLLLSGALTPAISLLILIFMPRENLLEPHKDPQLNRSLEEGNYSKDKNSNSLQKDLKDAETFHEDVKRKHSDAENAHKEQSMILTQVENEKEAADIELKKTEQTKKQTTELLNRIEIKKNESKELNRKLELEINIIKRIQVELDQTRKQQTQILKKNKELNKEIKNRKQDELELLNKSRLAGVSNQIIAKRLRWN